jgi:signal transduction histidine kinase
LTDVAGECWATVDTRDATIEIVDEMTFQGDADRLRRVFGNRFRNAVEHGGSDGTVRVGRDWERGLCVDEDGPRLRADQREDAFEPGHASAGDGTGFGPTMIKGIGEAHGWEVSVSDGIDAGARFRFEIADSGG